MKKLGTILLLCFTLAMSASAYSVSITKVDTFQTMPVALTACEEEAGSGLATFNLVASEGDIVTLLPNMVIIWYVDAALTTPIIDANAHLSGSASVYANITSTLDTINMATQEVVLQVFSTPDLSYLESIPDTFCGRPIVVLGDSFDTDATITWTPADFLSSDSVANPVFTPDDLIDVYSYIVTAVSADGNCTAADTVSFVVLTAEMSIDGPDTVEVCQGEGMVTLTATTLENPENIIWSSSRDTLSNLSGATTSIDAEYSTTIIATQLFANGCIIIDTVFIRVDSLPEFEISVIPDPMEPCQKYCPGTTVTMITNAPDLACYPDIMHIWTPNGDIVGADTNLNVALQLSNANTQRYTRTTTNHACTEVDTHTIRVVDTIIDINNLPTDRICRGESFTLMIDDSDWVNLTEVNWSTESMDITLGCEDCQTNTITVSEDAMAGSVNIVVTGVAEECCDASGLVNFNIVVPIVPIQPLRVCIGGSGQIIGDPTFTNYEWTNVTGGNLSADNISNPMISNVGAGGASMMVNAIAPDGCPSEVRFLVSAFKAAAPQFTAPNTCEGGSSQVIADPTFTNYVWTRLSGQGDINDPNIFNPLITNVGPNGIELMVSATNADGCLTDTTFVISVTDLPAIPILVDSTCAGGESQLTIVESGLTNIVWSFENQTTETINDVNISNPLVSNVGTNGVTLRVTALDAGGCIREGTATIELITQPIAPTFQVGPAPCRGGAVQIIGPSGFSYSWSILAGIGTIDDMNAQSPTISDIVSQNITLQVMSVAQQTNCMTMQQLVITTFQAMGPTLEPPLACPKNEIIIDLPTQFSDYVFEIVDDSLDINFSVEGNELVIPNAPDSTFEMILQARDGDGCLVEEVFTIEILGALGCAPFFVNAIAPLDTERPENNSFQPLDQLKNPFAAEFIEDFQVFNRWGQKVYDNDSNATGWDGRQNGELAPSDVYIYIVKIQLADGKSETFTGDVTLIR